MPPAVSDNESVSDIDEGDVPDFVPARATETKGKAEKPESEDEEGGSDDEDAEDVYSVDAILEHRFERGAIKYKVKWLGYEDEADMTWEPAENLETAPEKLQEYHDKIGGPPQPPTKGKKKGTQKRTASEALDSPVPGANKKHGSRKSQTNGTDNIENGGFKLPKGSWEAEVAHVMSIVEDNEPSVKGGKPNKVLQGFIVWNDGRKSKHALTTLRTKCPQALLTYYENHLVFTKTEDVPAHFKTNDEDESKSKPFG